METVKLTYDLIFELLVREKSREELQKLDIGFFNDLVSYISEKRKSADSTATDTFSLEEKERASRQLQNISRMLTELYERREKKVINMALIRSRTGADIIDTTPLLSEEKMLFDALVAQLDYYRNNILYRVLNAQPATFEEKKAETTQKEQEGKETKLIRFIHAVPKFIGKELEIYGPFSEEDVASLPAEIAKILIDKGRAEEIS